MSSNGFYKDTQEPTNSILKHSNNQSTSQSNFFQAKPFDSKTNFSALTKIDTKFKSEYFAEKNTVINPNFSYTQNIFESINDVIKHPPDLSSIPSAFVSMVSSVNSNTNTVSHRENITNLLNRRNNLNNIKVTSVNSQSSDQNKKTDLNANKEANANAIKTSNEISK